MKQGNYLQFALISVFFVLLQVLLFRELGIANYAICFIYTGVLLLLPYDFNPVYAMLYGFGIGLVMDAFYDSVGVNAAAAVLMMFARPYVFNLFQPRGGYDSNNIELNVRQMGLVWFLKYMGISLLIHHLAFFFLDTWTFDHFFVTLFRVVSSVLYTSVIFILLQYLIFKPTKS